MSIKISTLLNKHHIFLLLPTVCMPSMGQYKLHIYTSKSSNAFNVIFALCLSFTTFSLSFSIFSTFNIHHVKVLSFCSSVFPEYVLTHLISIYTIDHSYATKHRNMNLLVQPNLNNFIWPLFDLHACNPSVELFPNL